MIDIHFDAAQRLAQIVTEKYGMAAGMQIMGAFELGKKSGYTRAIQEMLEDVD